MLKCIHCGHDNQAGELICAQCNLVLGSEQNRANIPDDSTQLLDAQTDVTNVPRWGTAYLGARRKLLFHVRGYDKPLVVTLAEMLVLGRYNSTSGEVPDVDLSDYEAQTQGVSRRHASIQLDKDALKVVDLGSANATYINGQKLIAHQARILRDGDELRLGQLVIRIHFA